MREHDANLKWAWGLGEPPPGKSHGTHCGLDPDLESRANELLRESVAGKPRSEGLTHDPAIVTEWMARKVRSREVLIGGQSHVSAPPSEATTPAAGAPDRAFGEGIRGRATNPLQSHLNGFPRGVRIREIGGRRSVGVGVLRDTLNTPNWGKVFGGKYHV